MTLSELIDRLGGKLVQGDPEWMVDGVNLCEGANPFDIVFADSSATVIAALSSKAGVVVLSRRRRTPPIRAARLSLSRTIRASGFPRLPS